MEQLFPPPIPVFILHFNYPSMRYLIKLSYHHATIPQSLDTFSPEISIPAANWNKLELSHPILVSLFLHIFHRGTNGWNDRKMIPKLGQADRFREKNHVHLPALIKASHIEFPVPIKLTPLWKPAMPHFYTWTLKLLSGFSNIPGYVLIPITYCTC